MRRYLINLYAVLTSCLVLAGCASEPPKPLVPGAVVPTPYQCEELRERNGDC